MEIKQDPNDKMRLNVQISMADVLKPAAENIAAQADEHLRRMFAFLRDLALRAKPEEHPHFDGQAQNHALYWLGEILATRTPSLPKKRIRIEDDDAFVVAEFLALGSVINSGNLRLVITQPGGQQVAVEMPHKWLHGEMGVAAFIRVNCVKTVNAR